MSLFKRPHVCACEGYVDIAVELTPLRELQSYAEFERLLREEIEAIYGDSPLEFHGVITYSTSNAPHSFTGCFTGHQMETLHKYDAAVEKTKQVTSEYEKMREEHELLLENNKDRKVTQKRLREEAKSRKRVRTVKREMVTAAYEELCLAQKLKNLFDIAVIRVPLR